MKEYKLNEEFTLEDGVKLRVDEAPYGKGCVNICYFGDDISECHNAICLKSQRTDKISVIFTKI